MKVIHLFRTSAAGYGLERNLLCTLPGLVDLGVEVVALAVTETRSGPANPDFVQRLTDAGVRWINVHADGRIPFRLARKLSGVFRTEDADIIHSHDYKNDLAMVMARTGRAARMTTIHGWLTRTLHERFYEWVNVQCCKRLDRVIVFCEDYRQRLLARGVLDERIRVIPVGIDMAVVPREGRDFRAEWDVPEDGAIVAQIGRLSPEKHPETFVEIAARLAKRFPEARFVLVGDGGLCEGLTRRIESLGLAGTIRTTGYVHGIADVLDAVDVAVNCSSTEGIPRTLLEAGASGVPAVAPAVGGVPDAIDDGVTGILCPPGDGAAIEAGVARLLDAPGLRRSMGNAAREHVTRMFGVAACSRRLVDEYEALLSERG